MPTPAESDDLESVLAAAHDDMDAADTFVFGALVRAFFDDMVEYRTGPRSHAVPSAPAAQR